MAIIEKILNVDVEPQVNQKIKHRHTGTKAIVKRIYHDEERGALIRVSTYTMPVIPELFILEE